MADYNLKGIGVIPLPDNLSEEEIQSALNSHPAVIQHLKDQPTKFGWDTITDRLKGKNTPIGDSPQNELKAIGTRLIQNVPLAGNYVPDNKETLDYQKQHPIISNMAKAESAIGSNLAASGGLAAIPALSRGLPWLISQTAGNAALGGADKAAQEHFQGQEINTADILKAMGIGGGATLVGAAASKFISPNMGVKQPKTYTPEPPQGSTVEDITRRMRWENPADPYRRSQEQLAALINENRAARAAQAFAESEPHQLTKHAVGVAGTTLGHGIDPTGGVASHILKYLHQNVLKNQIMNDPGRAAIMQSLLMGGGQGLNRLPDAR